MKKLIIAVDLGHFKAYRVTQELMESPKIELVENYDMIEAHAKLGERVSDKAGRFGMGGERGNLKGYGEPHHMKLESERRLIKQIVRGIKHVLKKEGDPLWYLAASKQINNQIIDSLDQAVKAKLEQNVKADLTAIHKSDILPYFQQ